MLEFTELKISEEEEKKCYENWESKESKEMIFNANIPLVWYILRRHYPKIDPLIYDDVVQSAMIGLWKAIMTYNPEKTKIATYASRCIINQIRMYFRQYYRHKDVCSLDSTIDGGNLMIKDVIADENDFTIDIEIDFLVNGILSQLEGIEKELMIDYYIKRMKQREMVAKYNVTQAMISRKIKKIRKKILDQINTI